MAILDLSISALQADSSNVDIVIINDIGKEGLFRLDVTDVTSVDDSVLIIIKGINVNIQGL